MARVNLYYMPSERKEYVIDFPIFNGGLNLYNLPYRLAQNESPDMENLLWGDGSLTARDGQQWVVPTSNGVGYAAAERLFHGSLFCHIGSKLWRTDLSTDQLTQVYDFSTAVGEGYTPAAGTFFRYGEHLYYKARGVFVRIVYDAETSAFTVESMQDKAYTPVTVINADAGSGTGDLYQPENRLSPKKTIWYNAAEQTRIASYTTTGDITSVQLAAVSIVSVMVGDTTLVSGVDYFVETVQFATLQVRFATAPTKNFKVEYIARSLDYYLPVKDEVTTIDKIEAPIINRVLRINDSDVYDEATSTLIFSVLDKQYSVYSLTVYGEAYYLKLKRQSSNYGRSYLITTIDLDTLHVTGKYRYSTNGWQEITENDAAIVKSYSTKYCVDRGSAAEYIQWSAPESRELTASTATMTEDPTVWDDSWDGDYVFWPKTGHILLKNPADIQLPRENNTVKITYSLANADAMKSVMDCGIAATYGADRGACIVLAGSEAQPNAYFWNGNNTAMDAGYWPMVQYNLAGDANEPVTGFGKQNAILIIFKSDSVGKAQMSTTEVDGRATITMDYTPINADCGCDLPGSIRLVENNVVFANTQQGVHYVSGTSAAYENNVQGFSLKVNGTPERPGLLNDARDAGGKAASMDDGQRYWLNIAGDVWVWDYTLSTQKDPAWFKLTGISAVAFIRDDDAHEMYHLDALGRISRFARTFSDYGTPFKKRFTLPVQTMGGYDRLKDVCSCILTMRDNMSSRARIQWQTDLERRYDQTDIRVARWAIVPRDLSYRSLLPPTGLAAVFRRKPRCLHVHHFTAVLESVRAEDMAIVSAQIYYKAFGRTK